MTIKLLQAWNGYAAGSIINTGDRATEAALVAQFVATYDTTGGTVPPRDQFSATDLQAGPTGLTAAQIAAGATGVVAQSPAGAQLAPDGSVVSGGAPVVRAQYGVPFILAGSATMGANGAFSGIPAQPMIYPRCWMYFPRAAVYSGSPAGWYYCEMRSLTAGVAYKNMFDPLSPGVPSVKVPVVSASVGAYTQLTSSNIVGPAFVIPAEAIGASGKLKVELLGTNSSDANYKTRQMYLGGYPFASYTDTTNVSSRYIAELVAVDYGMQVGSYLVPIGSSSSAFMRPMVNGNVAQMCGLSLNIANVASFASIENISISTVFGD